MPGEGEKVIYEYIVKISDEVIEDVFDPDLPPRFIRCKDCKYAYRKETDLSNSYECRYPFSIIKENHCGDFFCANAEPKEGEQE